MFDSYTMPYKHHTYILLLTVINKIKPGILKSFVNKWLPELPAVLAYHTAQRHHGGSGATYVLLKKSADKKHENR